MKDEPLLITYPRSGTHFLCYLLEFLSKKPTGGTIGDILIPRNSGENNFVVITTHKGFKVINDYYKVILLIRNYKECLLRNLKKHWNNRADHPERVKAFMEGVRNDQAPRSFMRNIEAFDEHNAEKILIYYEDLVSNTAVEIHRLIDFLDLPTEYLKELLDNIDLHRRSSVFFYDRKENSATKGDVGKLTYHSRDLSPGEKRGFDEYYETHYPEIYEKYLRRYKEK